LVEDEDISGRIVSHQGISPGPASGITYTIDMQMPSGGVVRLAGQRPSIERWTDTLNVRAVANGTRVRGWRCASFYYWDFRELPDFGPCGGSFGETFGGERQIPSPPFQTMGGSASQTGQASGGTPQ